MPLICSGSDLISHFHISGFSDFLCNKYEFFVLSTTVLDLVKQEDERDVDFPSHKLALGEITALRGCIPKKPKFISNDNQIINMSLSRRLAKLEEYL